VKQITWRTLGKLLVAFALWSVAAWYAFPGYAKVVIPATSELLQWIRPHGLDVSLVGEYPHLRWAFEGDSQGQVTGWLSFTLLAYNAVLYLALVTAFPGLSAKGRLLFAASGAPVVLLFHVADLAMTVESRMLSVLQAEHYDFLHDFGLWFSMVKFYNFLSIMALKQIVFVGLFYVQWRTIGRRSRPIV